MSRGIYRMLTKVENVFERENKGLRGSERAKEERGGKEGQRKLNK